MYSQKLNKKQHGNKLISGFEKLSMGNEMGNNNTSALKEEDKTSEAEKKNFQEEVHSESVEKENQIVSADTKADGLASDDTIQHGNETFKGDTNGDGIKGENQRFPTSKAEEVIEEVARASDDAHTPIELGKDILEDDVERENQTIPAAQAENIEEKVTGLASVESIGMLGNDSSKIDTHGDDVIVENQMPPSALADGSLERDTYEDDENGDHPKHPSDEGEVIQVEAVRVDLDDKTSKLKKDKSQKDTHEQGEDAINPISGGRDMLGNTTSLSSDDQSIGVDSFSSAAQEITEIRRDEKSPNAGLVEKEVEDCKILSSSLLGGTEDCEDQEQNDLYSTKNLLVTCDNHLDNEPSTKQDEENTKGSTSDALGISNDAELQESSDVQSDHNELVKVLAKPSGSESLQSDLQGTDPFHSLDEDDTSERETEIQEKILCGAKMDGGDRDESGCSVRYASEITDDSSSIGDKSNGSLHAKVNHITDHDMNSQPESDMVYDQMKSDQEEKSKVLCEEGKLSRSGSKTEISQDLNPGQFREETLKEFKADITNTHDMTVRSNGICNGEEKIVLTSSMSGINNTDQVEEPKVTENGHQFDVCISNHNTSDEISTAAVQEDFMVPEDAVDALIPGTTVVNFIQEEKDNKKEKGFEEIDKIPEVSHTMVKCLGEEDMSKQFNSHVLTSDQKDSFASQTSGSLSYQEDNVNHTKSFTSISLQASDSKQENDSKSLGATGDNFDSSNLNVPALDLIDDEAVKKEGQNYSLQAEATSLKQAEITTSEANLPRVPFLNNSICANGSYEVESVTRSSTESNPDNPNISALMQKSPSFNLNLRIEARPEESDRIPLLLEQGKTAIEGSPNQTSLNLTNSKPHAEYEPCILQHEEMPVEEKVVTMERSYSENFKAPFLGLLKEEEEAHLLVMPKKQDNHVGTVKAAKEMASASPKGKEKRKPRPFFFSSCMCCATVTN